MEVVVLDFETTGLSFERHRVIEIGAVILNSKNEVIDTYQTLCDPKLSKKLAPFITKLTGITDATLVGQLTNAIAMEKLHDFIGNRTIICHNATFDSKFLIAEMKRINKTVFNQFICTLLLSRRLFPEAESHKLSSLKKFINFKSAEGHKDHRALDDVLVTVLLWQHLITRLKSHIGEVDAVKAANYLRIISALAKPAVGVFLEKEKKKLQVSTNAAKFFKKTDSTLLLISDGDMHHTLSTSVDIKAEIIIEIMTEDTKDGSADMLITVQEIVTEEMQDVSADMRIIVQEIVTEEIQDVSADMLITADGGLLSPVDPASLTDEKKESLTGDEKNISHKELTEVTAMTVETGETGETILDEKPSPQESRALEETRVLENKGNIPSPQLSPPPSPQTTWRDVDSPPALASDPVTDPINAPINAPTNSPSAHPINSPTIDRTNSPTISSIIGSTIDPIKVPTLRSLTKTRPLDADYEDIFPKRRRSLRGLRHSNPF